MLCVMSVGGAVGGTLALFTASSRSWCRSLKLGAGGVAGGAGAWDTVAGGMAVAAAT